MKIKLQQHNKQKSQLDIKPTGKQNCNPLNVDPPSKQSSILAHQPQSIPLPSYLRTHRFNQPEVAPYEKDILQYLVGKEEDFNLTKKHKKGILKSTKRVKIVEFFGELCTKYRLRKKTLFLATHYYDQYSQRKSMTVLSSEKQAVVAQACLFIAMKFEEIYPPQLKTWCSSIEEVVKAEALILKDLNFRLSYTSAQHYLELYLSKHPVENSQKQLYQCILELFLVTGRIYEDHPLRIVQNVLDSFRPTLFLESHLVEVDRSIKQLILQNPNIWQGILTQNKKYSKIK